MNKKAEIDMIDVLLYASAPYTGKNEIERTSPPETTCGPESQPGLHKPTIKNILGTSGKF